MNIKTWLAFPLIVAVAQLSGGEVICNGIELPAKWPPARTRADILSGEPMRVPYLERPPAVIDVDVGRQLFVDDFLIEQTGLARRFHVARQHPGNPVLRPDRRWERFPPASPPAVAMAFSDGCFYDPQDRLFKLWYMASHGGMGVCYATSEDGISWRKPSLDVRPGTNIVVPTGQRGSSAVWLDHDTKDPSQRFKLMVIERDIFKHSVRTSPDGIHWGPAQRTGPTADRATMFYNPFRKVWVFSLKEHTNPQPVELQGPALQPDRAFPPVLGGVGLSHRLTVDRTG